MEQFRERGCEFALSEVWEKGGEGGIELANKVLLTLEQKESHFKPLYPDDMSLEDKIATVARDLRSRRSDLFRSCQKELKRITDMGMSSFPVCMAKTVFSFDDQTKLGRPNGFYHQCARGLRIGRSRLCRCSYRFDHDDAGTFQEPGGVRY